MPNLKGKKKMKFNLENTDSLFNLVEKWLERIPFLSMKDFDFTKKYERVVSNMLDQEVSIINSSNLSEENKKLRIHMLKKIKNIFNVF